MAGFIPLSQRPEWADLTPIPQKDPADPVVPIDYPDEFREAMDYFRAILAKDEKSARALELTAEIIDMNAANYTAWYYRRRCLDALKADLKEELSYAEKVARENPKNYQVWFHRQAIVQILGDPSGELDGIAEALEGDAKNYHAWSYRMWLLKTFELWNGELEYLKTLLDQDMRNNSAWNERWFVIQQTEGEVVGEDVMRQEIEFALGYLKQDMSNESPWNYIKGYLRKAGYKGLSDIREKLLNLVKTEEGSKCVHLQALLIEMYEKEGDEGGVTEAAQMAEVLGRELDVIRGKYWLNVVQGRINRRLLDLVKSPRGGS